MEEILLNSKSALITGANGFIGSHLVKRLIKSCKKVSIIVRETSDLWRIEHELKGIHMFKGDIRDKDFVNKVITDSKSDYVFHVGAYGVDFRQKDYQTAVNTNIIGTINILEALITQDRCKRVINMGTSMQYGNKEGIIDEGIKLTPSNIYGSSKAAATIIAHQIAAENNIDIITLIPFGVFGENEGTHKFFPHVINSILNHKDIELSGCEQYRDYCYIENIVDGIIMSAKYDAIKNEVFNIGSGKVHQLRFYVDMIYKYMCTESKPKYGVVPYRKNDLWCPQPDITKIKTMIGWEQRISLDEGVKKTIEWFEKNYIKYKE